MTDGEKKQVETEARKICQERGTDPDAQIVCSLFPIQFAPAWMHHVPDAAEHLGFARERYCKG